MLSGLIWFSIFLGGSSNKARQGPCPAQALSSCPSVFWVGWQNFLLTSHLCRICPLRMVPETAPIAPLSPKCQWQHWFVSALSEVLWSRHQFMWSLRATTPLPYLWKMHILMRIPRFVLLIIVNSDLQMTRPLYNFFLCIPFFWKLPETFGLGLIHTPILIKHSFDFPLFPSSLYQWFSYISGMMKKAGN